MNSAHVERTVLDFETNVVLRAGAGTGKTEALAGLYLALLAGVTSRRAPVPAARIVAITFTEKAASEMKERAVRVLAAIARGESPLPRLAGVLAARARADGAPLNRSFAARALDELSAARIMTVHAFAASVLRAHAALAGLDPAFRILEEREARALLEDALVHEARAALSDLDGPFARLLRDVGALVRRPDGGLLEALRSVVLSRAGRLGVARPGDRATDTPNVDDAAAASDHAVTSDDLSSNVAAALATLLGAHRALLGRERHVEPSPSRGSGARRAASAARNDDARARLVHALAELEASGLDAPTLVDVAVAAERLDEAVAKSELERDERSASLRAQALDRYVSREAAVRAAALEGFVSRVHVRYSAGKRRAGAVDFDDLEVVTRDLLRDHPAVRREVVASFDALLVDEFQDTNATQGELVYLLRARDGFAQGVPSPGELAPSGLFVVGDRKQAIYGFRGADVTVFERIRAELVGVGGQDLALGTSYRSVPGLVDAVNVLAEATLTSGGRTAHELAFDRASEALVSARPAPASGAALELLEPADTGDPSFAEPIAIARHLVALVRGAVSVETPSPQAPSPQAPSPQAPSPQTPSPQTPSPQTPSLELALPEDVSPEVASTAGGLVATAVPGEVPLRFGDVALLLPRFTRLGTYLRALDAWGVPYVIVRGRGLLETVEARDVVALGEVLVGSDAGLALAAVLRGPVVGASDAQLAAFARDRGLVRFFDEREADERLFASLAAPRDEDEAAAVARMRWFRALASDLRESVDRIGVARALSRVVAESGLDAVLVTLPSGAQRLANVKKLLGEIEAREDGGEDGRAIVAELSRRLARREAEAEADVAAEGEDAVSILTVHQSKGLEFRVVIAADLGARPPMDARKVRVHPITGAIVVDVKRPRSGDWASAKAGDGRGPREPAAYQAALQLDRIRAEAERKRLFYVQMTRARDHLVLAMPAKSDAQSMWKRAIEPAAAELEARGLARRVSTEVPAVRPGADAAHDGREVTFDLGFLRARALPLAAPIERLEVSVTHLEDLALCPRRYRGRHVLGLPERPLSRATADPKSDPLGGGAGADDDGVRPGSSAHFGTLVHAVLERIDLALAATAPDDAVEAALRREGLVSADGRDVDPAVARVRDTVRAFFATAFARGVAEERRRVERELPFTLLLDGGPTEVVLHGRIDLLVRDAEGRAQVIDYKTFAPRRAGRLEPFRVQLGAYALALARAEGILPRVGLVFLDGTPREPLWLDVPSRSALEGEYADIARRLALTHASASPEGRPKETCDRLECGYRYLCHPRPRRRAATAHDGL